jgi:pre-mRNA-splicing factor SPF27
MPRSAQTLLPSTSLATPTGKDWTNASPIDAGALPYVDDDATCMTPARRTEIDRLIAEEMRRMPKRARDYLAELAEPTSIEAMDARVGSMTANALSEAEHEPKSVGTPDTMRYRLDPPPQNKRSDVEAWKIAIDNAMAQLEHQATRVVNLELALKYAPAAWRARNAWCEATNETYARELEKLKGEVNALNAKRKLQQEAARNEFGALEREWYATTAKCAAIEGAVADLESRLASATE